MHIVDVNSQILEENSRLVEINRKMFAEQNIYVANFMSAPGAGKTTLLEKTKVFEISNDLFTDHHSMSIFSI
jgi:hydrogenase nickel incorporation protein HypB